MPVIDASVAAKWFLGEGGANRARALLERDDLIAPDLLIAEVLNTLWRRARRGAETSLPSAELADALLAAFAKITPSAELAARALELAQALDHPVYDALYLALAEREGEPLITADKALLEKAKALAQVEARALY